MIQSYSKLSLNLHPLRTSVVDVLFSHLRVLVAQYLLCKRLSLLEVNSSNSVNTAIYLLQSSGVGLAPGGWSTGSDERIKTEVEEIEPDFALQAVLDIRNVKYKMRDISKGSGGDSCGYIAQDIQKWLPKSVSTADFTSDHTYRCRGDNDEIVEVRDMLNIDPGKISGALNGAAIKALYAKIQGQAEKIVALQNRLYAIENQGS